MRPRNFLLGGTESRFSDFIFITSATCRRRSACRHHRAVVVANLAVEAKVRSARQPLLAVPHEVSAERGKPRLDLLRRATYAAAASPAVAYTFISGSGGAASDQTGGSKAPGSPPAASAASLLATSAASPGGASAASLEGADRDQDLRPTVLCSNCPYLGRTND